jgi:hypothetical protein
MTYDAGGRSLWRTALAQAERLLSAEPSRAPVRWTLLLADGSEPATAEQDVEPLLSALRTRGEPAHARPLGETLRRAAALLADAPEPNRRLYVLTDLAAHAWRDAPRGLFANVTSLDVSVMAASAEARSNLALLQAEGTRQVRPAATPLALNVAAAAFVSGAQCRVLAQADDALLDRSELLDVPPGRPISFPLILPPLPVGAHDLTLLLEPRDRLDFDQARFAALEVGPRPTALLITDRTGPADMDLTALILNNLIAPAALHPSLQAAELRIVSPESLPRDLPSPLVAVLAGRVELDEPTRKRLLDAVQRGGQLLMAPSAETAAEWPGLAGRVAESISTVDDAAVTTMQFEPDSPLMATADEGLAELTRTSVRRRLQITPAAGARVHARYTDGSPALLSRRQGDGALWLLTTSPDPKWSDLGSRAAGLITLVHRLIALSAGPPGASANLVAGESSTRSFASLPADALVRVTGRAGGEAVTHWVRLAGGTPREPWPTEQAGLYSIYARGESSPVALYAVNWPAEESDTTLMAPGEIAGLLGVDGVEQVFEDESSRVREESLLARLGRRFPPEPTLAVLLVALFAVELGAANRARAAAAKAK